MIRGENLSKLLSKIKKEFSTTVKLYHCNSGVIYKLYIDSRKKRRFAEAFLYFYFLFELSLRYMIITDKLHSVFKKAIKGENVSYPKADIKKPRKKSRCGNSRVIFAKSMGIKLKKI